MGAITHVAMGAAIGAISKSSPLGFLWGLLSHLLGDIIPHYDYDYRWETLWAGLLFGLFLLFDPRPIVFWGMLGSVLPDIETLLLKMGYIEKKQMLFPTHYAGFLPHGREISPRTEVVLRPLLIIILIFVAELF